MPGERSTRRLQAISDARVESKTALGCPRSIRERHALACSSAWSARSAMGRCRCRRCPSAWRLGAIGGPHHSATAARDAHRIVTPATGDPTSFALSPDGRQIVFVASSDGPSRLWLRSLAATTAQPLAGTEGARASFLVARQPRDWFLRRGRAEAARSRRRRATDSGAGPCGSRWDLGRGRRHRVCTDDVGSLMRVAAAGGDAVPVTTLGPP